MDFTDREIGHYRVLNRLGEGGMGVVYRAVDTRLSRIVAMKFLPQHLWSDEPARNRMLAEGRAASRLDHPNIATVFEIGDAPDAGIYIAMAYYSGEPLSRRIRAGPLSLHQSVDIATQIARGLACAHAHGIVHRDIKPDNIMLMPDGLVKILDFGLAKSEGIDLTVAGATLGTPAFMAPEQILGGKVDQRCDLWALGVVFYNMLTGRRPFTGNSAPVLAGQILRETPEFPAVPQHIRDALRKALSRNAANRFQTAQEFISALGSAPAFPDPDSMPTVAMTPLNLGASLSRDTITPNGQETPTGGTQATSWIAEFRQVTLVSCELVEPAAIEAVCGLEALLEIQVAFEDMCADVARRFGGEASAQSDSEMRLHFGYPQAQEGDSVSAVTAGLDLVEAVAALELTYRTKFPQLPQGSLRVRVGVHTGSVIAGGDGTRTRLRGIFGSAGTLVCRVQQAAGAGQVCITAETLNLVRGFFSIRELGETRLTGFSRPVALFCVLGKTSAASRLEATGVLTELVSRERELGMLSDCWSETKEGHGQTVLLSGDPGIGKSRLVRAFRERLADQQPTILEARSSPYHCNSPLYPILEMLGKWFDFERHDPPAIRLAKLKEFLAKLRFNVAEGLTVIAPLLALPLPPELSAAKLQPQRQKDKDFSTILKLIETAAARTPVLWIVEDLHWADPTTIELLGLAVVRTRQSRILTVVTTRSEYSPPWANASGLQPIDVGRISRREAELMILRLAGGKRIPREMTARLIENAEGVPLFVEELTRNVLTSGVLRDTPQGYELAGPIASLAIPSTLRDSLMSRLDRLGKAKSVAQIASVLGRTFSQEWLDAICPVDPPMLKDCLARLVEADILLRRGTPPEVEYTFRHALIMDAAYQSMLTRTRQEYHERFARTLELVFPEIAELHPELLAHHFTDGCQFDKALSYWLKAGDDARRRSANIEAAAHYGRGIELTSALPDGRERAQIELGLWTALAAAQLATEGYAAAGVGKSFHRVAELSERVGLSRPLFDALQGRWAFQVVRAELETALESAGRLAEIAVGLNDPSLRLEAVLRRGITLSIAGRLAEAHQCFTEVAAGSAEDHRGSAFLFGQDRLVACLCHLSLVLCLQGDIRGAIETSGKAVALARELAHPFSLSWAYLYAGLVHTLRDDSSQTREYAEALKLLSEEQGFAYRLAQAQILGGWATVSEFGDESGLDEIRRGIHGAFATGARVYGPYYHALYAEACLKMGLTEPALEAVEAGLNVNPSSSERVFESQLLRLRAETLLRLETDSSTEAIRILNSAASLARTQGATLSELRALNVLALLEPGNTEALQLLDAALGKIASDGKTEIVESARATVESAQSERNGKTQSMNSAGRSI